MKPPMATFVRIRDAVGDEDPVEVPSETNGTLLLSTVVAQFPGSVGLRYQGGSGLWRACRMIEGIIDPPIEGWDGIEFSVVKQGVKRSSAPPPPANNQNSDAVQPPNNKQLVLASEANKQVVPFVSKYIPELKISNFSPETNEEDVRKYFETFGELEKFAWVRKEGMRRGFGFIRYKSIEVTDKVRQSPHDFEGRRLYICPTREAVEVLNKERTNALVVAKLGSGKELVPYGAETAMIPDIMIANLPYIAGDAEIRSYFEGFGELETFQLTYDNMGKPKGFGFIKYKTVQATKDCLSISHTLQNRVLDVSPTKRAMEMLQVGYGVESLPNDGIATKLFVGRLPYDTTEADLYTIFSDYSIKTVNLPMNGSKGCGFVTLSSISEAYRVMNDTHMWKGKCLNVSAADKRKGPNPDPNRVEKPQNMMNKTELNEWMLEQIQKLSAMTPEQRMQAKVDVQRQELLKTTKNATAYDYGYGGRGDIGNTNQDASNPSWGSANPPWGGNSSRGGFNAGGRGGFNAGGRGGFNSGGRGGFNSNGQGASNSAWGPSSSPWGPSNKPIW